MRAFVIAMECEAACVRPFLKTDERLYVSGVGKVNAAAATQKAIDDGADEIVNFGLAGGFGGAVEVGGVYEVVKAVQYDFDLAELNGTAVGVLDGETSPYEEFEATGCFPARILATGDRFNNDEGDHALIVDALKCSLRDMEGAAVAQVCRRNGVKCRAFKCVSDLAGSGAMTEQYLVNREKCLKILADVIARRKFEV